MCLEEGDVENAASYYSWAEEMVPGVADHYQKLTVQMAGAFIARAYEKGASGEWLAASENWTAAKSFLKGKPYEAFGDLAERLAGDYRTVQQTLLAADIAKNAANKVARIYLAQAYNAGNEGQKALDAIAPLLEEMPDDTRVWQQQGQALISLNRLAEAEGALQEAVRLMPNDLQALNRVGVLYLATGRLPQAEDAFRHALASPGGSDAYWVWDHLAETLEKQGKTDEAAEAVKKKSEIRNQTSDGK